MKFRDVVLVVILILAGFVFFQFKTGKWSLDDLDWNWDGDFGIVGREYAEEESRTVGSPLPPVLEIENGHGWVEVRGADREDVQLTFKKVVWRRTEEEAKDVAGRIKYELTTADGKLALKTNRDEFRKKNFETGFVLTVPRSMAVRVTNGYGVVRVDGAASATVRNRHGELYATNVDGPCELETSYDDLEVQNVKGACKLVNSHADVRAVSVTGDLTVETSYARIRIEDAGGRADLKGSNVDVDARRVAGAVTVDTSYEKVVLADVGPAVVTGHNMAVAAENVRGDLEIRTSYEPVRVRGVEGRLSVEAHNAAVEAGGVRGPAITISTSYEPVVLTDFSAEVKVVNRNGGVTLQPLDLKFGLDVRSEYGAIDLVWPAGEVARLEARSKGGSVTWGLTERPDVERSNGEALVTAFTASAGAPQITLATTYDAIRIKEGARKF
ncbi:MAG: hypothetical protein MUE80_06455 [Acidobacteria bacterium]|nr:hypothetical protein [Acidobacteriota bacterium]